MRYKKEIRVVNVLALSPETVALFDELSMIDEEKELYSEPTSEWLTYFEGLANLQLLAYADPAKCLLVSILHEFSWWM